jgi:hypothetical protein
MPVSYSSDAAAQVIRIRCTGYTTFPEVMDHFRTFQNDVQCPDRAHVLLDLTEITSLPESHQLRAAGTTIGLLRPTVCFGACAIVASSDAMFGTARMFEVFADEYFHSTQVFRTGAEAEEWLATRARAQSAGA